MTKDQLITAIAAKTARSKVEVGLVLDGLRASVVEAVQRGEDVTVPDLVKLTVQRREARIARNPATGASVDVPAKRVVKAKVVKALAALIE